MNKFTSGAAFPDLSPTINNFADNLVRLKMHQDNVDYRARQMEAQQPILDAQVAEAKMKMEKMERERAQAQQPVDLTVHPMRLAMPEETRPQILDFFRQNGLVNERGIGTMEGLARGVGMIENSKPLFESFMGPVVQAKKNSVIKAFDALTKAQESGDPKKIQTAQAEFERVNMQYQTAAGNFDKHLDTLSKHQQAMELEKAKTINDLQEINARTQGRIAVEQNKRFAPRGGGSAGGGKPSDFERKYQDYVVYAQQNYPDRRLMTRGEFAVELDRQKKMNTPRKTGGGSALDRMLEQRQSGQAAGGASGGYRFVNGRLEKY
ncbi:MAG: hypothetical protein WCY59_07420 [Anaerovoracaceae bacterium]